MDSKLIIAKGIKIDKNYTNVLSYDTNGMLALVEKNAEYSQDNYNYIDYDKREILADVDYSLAIECNYIAFQNPRHGNKWYFAFIEDCIYKAPKQCKIVFSIDVWSTFFDNWTAKSCFVVREHVNDDAVGKHTVPENVTTGEYIVQSHLRDSYNRGNQRIVVSANITPSEGEKVFGGVYQGVPTGYRYFSYPFADMRSVAEHILLAESRQGDINQLFIAPEWLAGTNILMVDSTTVETRELGISPITNLDGYAPKNNKLLSYPYVYILLSNGQGQEAIMHQELWEKVNGEMKLEMIGSLTAGCSIRLVPKNYKNDPLNFEEGINLGKFPQLNWSTDSYINWQTQQGINQGFNAITNTIRNPDPSNAMMEIANLLYSDYRAQEIPPQVHGNMNAGDVVWASRENCFHNYRITIRREFAKQIDDYFSRFGYKINETKIPNIYGRSNFNFVEIGKDECIGYGDVPSKYMEQINDICRQGVTIWHNHENLGNYAVNNGIIKKEA